VFIISPEITAEQMGFAKQSLKEIARKNNEGYYINLIESLPIDRQEKKRLLADADIQDIEPIEEEFTEND
jgi:Lon protease-like protein